MRERAVDTGGSELRSRYFGGVRPNHMRWLHNYQEEKNSLSSKHTFKTLFEKCNICHDCMNIIVCNS